MHTLERSGDRKRAIWHRFLFASEKAFMEMQTAMTAGGHA